MEELEAEKGEERTGEGFLSLDEYNCQLRVQLKPGTRSFIWVFCMDVRDTKP